MKHGILSPGPTIGPSSGLQDCRYLRNPIQLNQKDRRRPADLSHHTEPGTPRLLPRSPSQQKGLDLLWPHNLSPALQLTPTSARPHDHPKIGIKMSHPEPIHSDSNIYHGSVYFPHSPQPHGQPQAWCRLLFPWPDQALPLSRTRGPVRAQNRRTHLLRPPGRLDTPGRSHPRQPSPGRLLLPPQPPRRHRP